MTQDANTLARQIGRRRVPRRDFQRRIGLLVRGQYSLSWAFQIGEGGMLLASPTPLAREQMLAISFRLPGELPFIVRAVVRYASEDHGQVRYGVEFVDLEFSIKRSIRQYVATSAPRARSVDRASVT